MAIVSNLRFEGMQDIDTGEQVMFAVFELNDIQSTLPKEAAAEAVLALRQSLDALEAKIAQSGMEQAIIEAQLAKAAGKLQ